jgi:hypothetical protein
MARVTCARLRPARFLGAVGALFALTALSCAGPGPVRPRPERRVPAAPDAAAVAAEIAAAPMRLSTGDRSTAARFDVRLRWAGRLPGGAPFAYDCLAARDGEAAAVVLLSPGGLPYCYMAGGLLLLVGAEGRVTALTQGAPFLEFERIAAEDRFQASAGFLKSARDPRLEIDLGSVFSGIAHKASRAAVDPAGRTLTLDTDRAHAVVGLPPAGHTAGFPVTSLDVRSGAGATAGAGQIRIGHAPSFDLRLTLAAVRRSGVQVREAAPSEFQDQTLLPPPGIDTDPQSREAAGGLARVLGLPVAH